MLRLYCPVLWPWLCSSGDTPDLCTLGNSACMPDCVLVKPQKCPTLAAVSSKCCALCVSRAALGSQPSTTLERYILFSMVGSWSQSAPLSKVQEPFHLIRNAEQCNSVSSSISLCRFIIERRRKTALTKTFLPSLYILF